MDRFETIRQPRPTEADARDIQDVFYTCWLQTYPNEEARVTREHIKAHFKYRNSKRTLAQLMKKFRNPLPYHSYLVAEADNRIVGVCRMSHDLQQNILHALYVHPSFQRRGIGMALLVQSLAVHEPRGASQARPTVVHMAAYNEHAIAFYSYLGFEKTGREITLFRLEKPSPVSIPEYEMVLKSRPAR